jgi:YD repeat-containing protein
MLYWGRDGHYLKYRCPEKAGLFCCLKRHEAVSRCSTSDYGLVVILSYSSPWMLRYAVNDRTVADGGDFSAAGHWEYQYSGGKYDDDSFDRRTGYEFRSYAEVQTTDLIGNLTISDFLQSGLYKGKPSEEKRYDANNQWQSATYYTCDGNVLLQAPETKGELWWVRRVRGEAGGRTYTLDTLYEYDSYGNRTRETSYNVEGYYDGGFTNDHPGTGEPRLPRAELDATYHSFPLTITNSLNQVERRTYDYRTGKPLTQTDPNNAKYVYTYDVFGRLKEVFSPTEADVSPDATVKYEYGVSTVPVKVTTMHRKDDSGANPAQYLVRPEFSTTGLAGWCRSTQTMSGATR